jgi:nicotinamide phosphoribosyltransferase
VDRNPIIDTDSYKLSHFELYPPEVTNVYSYGESRGGRYPATLFFGLQPWLRQLVERPVTLADVAEAEDFARAHGEPFNIAGWLWIVQQHGGYLPVRIKAVAEGTLVPTHNVLVTVENLDPKLPWLTSYVETAILRQVWYATTVATRIFNMKRRIKAAFDRTADDHSGLPFALLDFSSRGCSSYGANEIGGAAYLANFLGSDSVPAVRYVNHYYDSPMSGFSVMASEHSVTTSWGKDRTLERKLHYIERAPPGSIISDVLDTWNCYTEAYEWVTLKDKLAEKNLTLVGRPDSGDIDDVLPELIRIFAQGFGVTTNCKGYEVINGAKLLWGDGINETTHMDPFYVAHGIGISAQSIMTGSGGGLMQADIDRDTCKFAFKASAISTDAGETWSGVAKDPITDPGKRSKMGRLRLIDTSGGSFETYPEEAILPSPEDELRTVYEAGKLHNQTDITEVRAIIDSQL